MKRIVLVVPLVLWFAAPALAQQGGVPALQAQIKALQAEHASLQEQITGLQTSLGGLQTQLHEVVSAMAADDGTAQALEGTWTGSVSSVEFDRSTKFTAPGSPPSAALFFSIFGGVPAGTAPNFAVPLLGPCTGMPGTCQTGAMMIGVNPEFWLAKSGAPGPMTFTLTHPGLKL